MRKKLGIVLIGLGTALIISALLLLLYNQNEDKQAGEMVNQVLPQIQAAIVEQSFDEIVAESDSLVTDTESVTTKIAMVNGYNYIGILNLPTLSIELPVLNECDELLLKVAPCRDYGDVATDDLVIAAHNYKNHFGRISQLQSGDEVTFTEIDGTVHSYKVSQSMMISPNDVELVTNSSFELVLYTCDYTNQNRIAIYCKK